MGAAQPGKRAFTLLGVAEHAHVDAGMAEIRACPDVGHGDESDTRVLEIADRVANHLADPLVHATHAI